MAYRRANAPSPLLGRVLKKIAPRLDAKVLIEPDWNIAGQITFKNGRKRYFRYSTLDINPLGAGEIAKDKDYARFFMKRMGYPAVPGKTFYADWWATAIGSRERAAAAYQYVKKIGFPVFVKPNSGSQGSNVAQVATKKEFVRALQAVFSQDPVALIQKPVPGDDYRIVVFDSTVACAYKRIPLSVIGDGKSSVAELLDRKRKAFAPASSNARIKKNDPRYAERLRRDGYTLSSIPVHGARVFLLDNANLSSGGESIDVTERMHPAWKKITTTLTRDMGLRFCGVDLIIDGDIAKKPERYHVLEINASPGLDHYAASGKIERERVEKLYEKIFKSLSR